MLLRTLGLTAAALLSSFCVDAAYSSSGPNVLYYWGQNSAGGSGTQASLATYCRSGKADGIILSFLNVFNVGGLPGLNFAGACTTTFPGLSLLSCPTIGSDIKVCQDLGVKVILSLGGAAGSYSLAGDAAAQTFAQTLWDLFGGGSSPNRPFGSSTIDGIDLDIEGGPSTGYAALVTASKAKFGSGFLVGAAPQCPFPDQILGSVIDAVGVDYVNVQFYNNYCSAAGGSFNFDTWARWAAGAPNRNVKVMLTLPGSTTAAGSGYVPMSTISSIVPTLASNYPGIYGGVAIWDASQAWNNGDFANSLYSLVKGNTGSPAPNPNPNPTTTTTTTTTTKAATTTTTSSSGPTGLPPSGSCIKQGQSCAGGGQYACTSNGAYAICNQGTWSVQGCPGGTVCIATDDKSSIYCGYATPGSNTCSVSAVSRLRESLTNGPVPKPYKSSQVSAELTIVSSHTKKFEAVINARRLNDMPFKKQVTIEFTAPENIKFTSASNGTIRQVGNKVRILVSNQHENSMSLMVGLKGSVEKGVFVAFTPSTLRFK